MTKTFAAYGPPGTGKTMAGTNLARLWFESGAAPDQVAYLAFTKAAALAACMKIMDSDEEIDPESIRERFPLFRTIHSLAFMGLRQGRRDVKVLTPLDMKRFSEETGYEASFAFQAWEDVADVLAGMEGSGKTHWDHALAAYSLSRISARTPDELEAAKVAPAKIANLVSGFLEIQVYQAFVKRYEAFKLAEGLIDFTDMLAYALLEMRPLDDVRFVVVDEAQDLCGLHFAIIDKLFRYAEEIWWIGDDDQAIYKFSGASAELFLERTRKADHQIVLRQTHRFGQEIVDFSAKVIRRVRDRVEKNIIGVTGRKGNITVTGHFEPVPGNALILHRHVAGCREVANLYIDAGLPFTNERGRNPLGLDKRIKVWKAVHELAQEKRVPIATAALLVEEIPSTTVDERSDERLRFVVHGAKKKVDTTSELPQYVNLEDLKALNILTDTGADVIRKKVYHLFGHQEDFEYYDRVVKNGYDLSSRGPTITTIHGSKGRQADRAIVFTEMGRRCWDDPETEHRLAYVAATRTKGDLTLCAQQTSDWMALKYNYPIGGE